MVLHPPTDSFAILKLQSTFRNYIKFEDFGDLKLWKGRSGRTYVCMSEGGISQLIWREEKVIWCIMTLPATPSTLSSHSVRSDSGFLIPLLFLPEQV